MESTTVIAVIGLVAAAVAAIASSWSLIIQRRSLRPILRVYVMEDLQGQKTGELGALVIEIYNTGQKIAVIEGLDLELEPLGRRISLGRTPSLVAAMNREMLQFPKEIPPEGHPHRIVINARSIRDALADAGYGEEAVVRPVVHFNRDRESKGERIHVGRALTETPVRRENRGN